MLSWKEYAYGSIIIITNVCNEFLTTGPITRAATGSVRGLRYPVYDTSQQTVAAVF